MKGVRTLSIALFSLIGACSASLGDARGEELMRGIPSADEWRRALEEPGPPDEAGAGGESTDETTRAIFPTPQPQAPEKTTKASVTTQPRPAASPRPTSQRAASALILFEYDSAALTPTAREQLDQLTEALASPSLSAAFFRIEGHTDAVGSDAYNRRLSEARAASVVEYLVEHGISSSRLQAVGLGENDLNDRAHPTAAENRRVKVVNLSS
ncbi:MAG: OmpA family protein [Rhodospirillales bacterium]|nr:OmpA family protein [Rhodospirillales bacterium]